MAIRSDQSIQQECFTIDGINDRTLLRNFILNKWMQESSGSKYRYFVETLINGKKIYLERPGRLNKGCDFVIFIEDILIYKNGNDKPPTHSFIIDDLKQKKQNLSSEQWNLLYQAITSIYNCESFDVAFHYCVNLPNVGQSYELILKTLRWFFIEQDITYWLGQGRSMFYENIQKI